MAWGHPVKGGYITSDYGPRPSPVPGASTYHQGTDFGGQGTDWKVRSVGDGTVLATGYNVIRGWWVAVRHNDGTTTTYQHLVKPLVHNGMPVKAGTTLGEMGATGVASGTHLHMEAFLAGRFVLNETAWASTGRTVDPEAFMLARGVNLADPSQGDDKTPEYRPDEPSSPDIDDRTPTTSEVEDMFIIQRGSAGSYFLCAFDGYQKISDDAQQAFVKAGVRSTTLNPAESDAITKSLRATANRTLNTAISTEVWRGEKAAAVGSSEQETMAAHLVKTRAAAEAAAK